MTWAQRLKNIPGIRSAKHRVWVATKFFSGNIHLLLSALIPKSKVWGSPRYFETSFQTFVENYNKIAGREPQIYIPLILDAVTVKSSRLVMGAVPATYENKDILLQIKEYVAILKPVRIYTPDLAIIAPDDTVVGEASVWYGEGRLHPVFKTLRLPKPYQLKGRGLYLRGESNYFHFLTDIVPSVHLLELAGIDIKKFDYILMKYPKVRFEHELMQLFGIPSDRVVDLYEHKHIEAEELTIPTILNRQGSWFVHYVRQKLMSEAFAESDTKPRKRLYVTRRNARCRRIINEESVFLLLRSYGFEFVECGDYSVLEQVKIFRDAEIIVGPHGAALTNLLFSTPGTKLLEIRARQQNGPIDNCFQRLCTFAEVKHFLLFTEGVSDGPIADPHELDIMMDMNVLQEQIDLVIAD